LTVADALRADGHEVAFVGTPDGLEARLVPEAGFELFALPARGIDRSRPWTAVAAVAVLASSAIKARRLIGEWRPDAIVAFGGYVALPLGVAADLKRVPLVVHEQNSVPGLANKVLSYWAERIGVTYAESVSRMNGPARTVVTGNPVRAAVLSADRDAGRRALGLPADATVLLVFGGSRGARHLNAATVARYERLMAIPDLHVVHVTGAGELDTVRAVLAQVAGAPDPRYHVVGYLDAMGDALAAADLVVSRAGATSLAELTALGRPMVLVPYPYATADHQTRNARSVVEAGAALLVADADLDGSAYDDALMGLLEDPEARRTMAGAAKTLGRPDAAERVARLVTEAVLGNDDAMRTDGKGSR
jgi:UDP-N-acetylglucosamine--N-acetylmuramyl-(pentapeptide) pyrophosphoryl-undecaprenol N-acetylglucosamine transferase